MPRFGPSSEAQRLQDERDIQDQLDSQLFAEKFPAGSPQLKTVTGPGSRTPAPTPPPDNRGKLGFADEYQPAASYENLFNKGVNIGSDQAQVSPEAVQQAGGVAGVQEQERFQTPGIRELHDIFSTALGETTATQRAAPQEMSAYQKGLLFVSDIVAAGSGRQMPSTLLNLQKWRALSLEDQQNREAFAKGVPAVKEFVDLISRLPQQDRADAALIAAPRLRQNYGEGFGAIAVALAAQPTAAESFKLFLNDSKRFSGGAADNTIKLAAFLAGAGDMDESVKVIENAIKDGTFDKDAQHKAPTIYRENLPGFLDELRGIGEDGRAFANKLEQGDRITPAELVQYNNELPINSPFRLPDSVVSTIEQNPMLFAADIPGMVTPEQQQEYQKALNEGEFSTPQAFIAPEGHPSAGKVIAAPQLSQKARNLLKDGWLPLTKLTGLGGKSDYTATTKDILSLRDDFRLESKRFIDVNASFRDILAAASDPSSPGGNVAMVFAFMKMFDPTSVVREGEQLTARQARSIPDAAVTYVNRLLTGQTLTDAQIQDFVRIAQKVWIQNAQQQLYREQQQAEMAGFLRIPDARMITPDYIGDMASYLPESDRPKGTRSDGTALKVPSQSIIDQAFKDAAGDPQEMEKILNSQGYSAYGQ